MSWLTSNAKPVKSPVKLPAFASERTSDETTEFESASSSSSARRSSIRHGGPRWRGARGASVAPPWVSSVKIFTSSAVPSSATKPTAPACSARKRERRSSPSPIMTTGMCAVLGSARSTRQSWSPLTPMSHTLVTTTSGCVMMVTSAANPASGTPRTSNPASRSPYTRWVRTSSFFSTSTTRAAIVSMQRGNTAARVRTLGPSKEKLS